MKLMTITTMTALCLAGASVCAAQKPAAAVTIEKPKPRTTNSGFCKIIGSGDSFSGVFGPTALPTLAFTIGPASAMADAMKANKAKYTGPGTYKDVIVAVYLGKTATEDAYLGLGRVTLNNDGHTGTFALNDGTASGKFDCGVVQK